MSTLNVTRRTTSIRAIKFKDNKTAIKDAVSSFATVRNEENDAIAITPRKGGGTQLVYPGQYIVIEDDVVSVYSEAGFDATFQSSDAELEIAGTPSEDGQVLTAREIDGQITAVWEKPAKAKAAAQPAKVKAAPEVKDLAPPVPTEADTDEAGSVSESVLPK